MRVDLSPLELLREIGPRFGRDAFGPALVFYVVWSTAGLVAGIAAATAVGAGLWFVAHRRGTRGVLPVLSLAIVGVQAVVGLATGSAKLYLAQPAIVGVVVGLAFLGSAVTARPLAGLVAADLLPVSPEIEASPEFRGAFRVVTLVWAGYLLVRAVGRLVVLAVASVEWFLVVTALSGAPIMIALSVWSGAYAFRVMRRGPMAVSGAEQARVLLEAAETPTD